MFIASERRKESARVNCDRFVCFAGGVRAVGVRGDIATLDGPTGKPLQGARLQVRVFGGRTKVSVAATGGRRHQPVRRRSGVHVYR